MQSSKAATALKKFDQELHKGNAFQAFQDFIDSYRYEYEAIAKDPPKEVEGAEAIMAQVKTVKIIGDNFNERGSNTDLILERIKKGKSCIVNSFALCSELALGCFSLHIQMLMYKAVYLNSVLFNSQTWTRLSKSDCAKLQTNQLKYLRRMMHAPNSTPNVCIPRTGSHPNFPRN